MLSFIDIDQLISAASEPDIFGMLKCVQTVQRLNALYKRSSATVLLRVHEIDAGLIERHGVN